MAALPYAKGAAKAGAGYAATEAIVQGAKKLPVVGDYIKNIAGVDYLPFLVGMAEGGKGAAAEAEAGAGEAASGARPQKNRQ